MYPEEMYRGVPTKDDLTSSGGVAASLFQFNKENTREDGFFEESINWNDHPDSLTILFNDRKENGSLHFPFGVAVIKTDEIDRIKKRKRYLGQIQYERRPIEGNPYHGNLLLSKSIDKKDKRNIIAGIALLVEDVLPIPS